MKLLDYSIGHSCIIGLDRGLLGVDLLLGAELSGVRRLEDGDEHRHDDGVAGRHHLPLHLRLQRQPRSTTSAASELCRGGEPGMVKLAQCGWSFSKIKILSTPQNWPFQVLISWTSIIQSYLL